jgi:hypothetical protein
LQNVRHEELLLEMASIKRSSQGTSGSSATMGPSTTSGTGWKLSRAGSTNQEVQTSPESGTSTPGKHCSVKEGSVCGFVLQFNNWKEFSFIHIHTTAVNFHHMFKQNTLSTGM